MISDVDIAELECFTFVFFSGCSESNGNSSAAFHTSVGGAVYRNSMATLSELCLRKPSSHSGYDHLKNCQAT